MKNKLSPEDVTYRKKIHLRNLERKYSKLIQHAEMTEECIKLKCEIDSIKRELS